jgi:hypothetical protein
MNRSIRRKLLIGMAVAAILAGGALAAVTAAGQGPLGHNHRGHAHLQRHGGHSTAHRRGRSGTHLRGRSQLTVAAGYLGVSPAQLQSERQSGKTLAQIADATPGKSEAGLIAALVASRKAKLAVAAATLPQRVSREVNRAGAPGDRPSSAARYLGLTPAQLHNELSAGKSLAQIADATPGKSAAGLIAALGANANTRLAAQVSAGKLTQAQANALLSRLRARETARVDHVRARHGSQRGSAQAGAHE